MHLNYFTINGLLALNYKNKAKYQEKVFSKRLV